MMEVVVTTGAYNMRRAPAKLSPSTNQHPVFTGRMPFLLPNQQCQSTEGCWLAFDCCFLELLFFICIFQVSVFSSFLVSEG